MTTTETQIAWSTAKVYDTIGVGCLGSLFATIRRLEFQSQNWRGKTRKEKTDVTH